MAAGAVGDLFAGEQARHLLDAAATVEMLGVRCGAAPDNLLLYEQMAVGKARDLRLVCHAQHLIGLRKFPEL